MRADRAPRVVCWVVLAVALAGCAGGSSSAQPATSRPATPSTVDVSNLEDPVALAERSSRSTTTEVANAPTTTAATTTTTKVAGPPDCAVIGPYLLPAASLAPLPNLPPDQALESARAIASWVPADLRAGWQDMVERLEGTTVGQADEATTIALWTASVRWAKRTCPASPAAWRCPGWGSSPVPKGAPNPPGGAGSPQQLLGPLDDGRPGVLLDQNAEQALGGWLDADGLVDQALVIRRTADGRWVPDHLLTCVAAS